ncbi:MAG: glycosyltransferase family 39 protein [Patescibacteria group bacterium]
MKAHRDVIIIAIMFLGILFASTYKLTESPSVWYDEGIYMQIAKNLADNGLVAMRFSPSEILHISKFTVEYPVIYPLAGVFKVFGFGILQARLLMVLFILGLAATGYFLIKKLFGPNLALLSLALLVAFPPLYGNGKSVLGETPGLFFVFLALLFIYFVRTTTEPKRKYVILAGLSAGLAIATKPLFLIFIPALIGGLFIGRKQISLKVSDLFVGVIAILIPIILWFATQFQAGDSFTEIFSFYANPYYYTFGEMFGVIIKNAKNFFTSIGPLYLLIVITIWLISLWTRIKRKITIYPEEATAAIFSLLCMLAYLRTTGMFRYFYPAQIISLIFFPSALLSLFSPPKKLISVSLATLFSLLIAFGVYQICFDSWVASAYASKKTADWQKYFEQLPSSKSVFFYDTPEVVIFMKGNNYYQYFEPLPEIIIGSKQLEVIRRGVADEIIIATNKFNSSDKTLFVKYHLSLNFYKYSILNKNISAK